MKYFTKLVFINDKCICLLTWFRKNHCVNEY